MAELETFVFIKLFNNVPSWDFAGYGMLQTLIAHSVEKTN